MPETWLLWIGPFALLLGAGAILYLRRRRGGNEAEKALAPEEEAALRRVLDR